MLCPECGELAERTPWVPDKGYDPTLVEYTCKKGHLFYVRTRRLIEAQKARAEAKKGGC